jgi:predicted phage tail protein
MPTLQERIKNGLLASVAIQAAASRALESRAMVRILDLIGEGEIEGLVNGDYSVYLNETPLRNADGSYNFQNVTVDSRPGTQGQTYIPGFESQETELSVGTEVTFSTPVVRAVTDVNVNQVRVTVGCPSLLSTDESTGNTAGTAVQMTVEVQPNGGAYTPMTISADGSVDTISGKASSRYQRSYLITLPGTGPWNIRVSRVTADSDSLYLQNKTFLDSYTEVIDSKLTYPNSALVGVRFDAQQFSSVPSRAYHVRLKKIRIPSNYNPVTRAYTGAWNGTFTTAYSNNPAWCFYDLITNTRYGLGSYIPEALADKWTLYTIAQYCDVMVSDGKGGTEPRFTLNVYIQAREEAIKLLQDLASVFRGMVYWSTNSVYAVQDSPADPVAIFNGTNVIDQQFLREGSGRKARHTAVVVQWNDPDNFFKPTPEYVPDAEGIARFGLRKLDVVGFGCSSQGQAQRIGKWILYTEKYEAEVISWRTGLDASYVRPGNVVKIVDPLRYTTRMGGRVAAATSNSVTIDAPYTILPATTYTLTVVQPDGTFVDRVLTNAAGATSVLTFATALPTTDIVQAVYVLSTAALTPEYVRVLSIVEDGPTTYKITGLQHYSAKYALVEQNVTLQAPVTSDLALDAGAVTNLAGSEYLYKAAGAVYVRLVISFTAAVRAARYRVSYRRSGGNWTVLPASSAAHYEIDNVVPGPYELEVTAYSLLGRKGPTTTATYQVLGKEGLPPANVGSLTLTGHTFNWPEAADLDLDGYRLKYNLGTSTDWTTAVAVHEGLLRASPYKPVTWPTGVVTYLIKAVDTSENESAAAAFVTADFTPPTVSGFTIEGTRLSWPTVSAADIAGYRIRAQQGTARSWGGAIPLHEGLLTSSPFEMPVVLSGTCTIMVKAVDAAGNESRDPAYIVTNLGDAVIANVVEVFDFKAMGWTGTLIGGTINGSNNLIANSNTLMWGPDDSVNLWNADSTALLWPGTFSQMTFEGRITVGEALEGSLMTIAATVFGGMWFIEYRENSLKLLWSADGSTPLWGADDSALLWELPPYLPWPGQVVARNTIYDFRITTAQGATQGEVDAFSITVDAPDIVEKFNDIVISSLGTRLPITKPFSVVKYVNATLQNDGGTAVTVTIEDKDALLGPLMKTRAAGLGAVQGLIDAEVGGY